MRFIVCPPASRLRQCEVRNGKQFEARAFSWECPDASRRCRVLNYMVRAGQVLPPRAIGCIAIALIWHGTMHVSRLFARCRCDPPKGLGLSSAPIHPLGQNWSASIVSVHPLSEIGDAGSHCAARDIAGPVALVCTAMTAGFQKEACGRRSALSERTGRVVLFW